MSSALAGRTRPTVPGQDIPASTTRVLLPVQCCRVHWARHSMHGSSGPDCGLLDVVRTVRSHTKDTHKSTEWKTGPTAQPLFAPQALTRRRWHGWLQEVRHLLYFRFSAGCCLAAASAAAPDLHRLLAAAHPQMRPRGRPESSAGASDKPALSFSWFSLCVAAASGVSFVRIITPHSSVNPLL